MSAAPLLNEIAYHDLGATIPRDTTWEQWRRAAQDIQWRHRAMMWQIGDLFIYGQQRFGERFAQAVEDYSVDTIQRAMRVCRIFPVGRRRPLGFSYHQAVETLEPEHQDKLLDAAVEFMMTREEFRASVRSYRDTLMEIAREERMPSGGLGSPIEAASESKVVVLDNFRPVAEPLRFDFSVFRSFVESVVGKFVDLPAQGRAAVLEEIAAALRGGEVA